MKLSNNSKWQIWDFNQFYLTTKPPGFPLVNTPAVAEKVEKALEAGRNNVLNKGTGILICV